MAPVRNSSWNTVLMYACIALLLIVGTAQAAHICGISAAGLTTAVYNEDSGSSPVTLCTFCLITHSVAVAILLVLVYSPNVQVRAHTQLPESHISSFRSFFDLYVRPPPAY